MGRSNNLGENYRKSRFTPRKPEQKSFSLISTTLQFCGGKVCRSIKIVIRLNNNTYSWNKISMIDSLWLFYIWHYTAWCDVTLIKMFCFLFCLKKRKTNLLRSGNIFKINNLFWVSSSKKKSKSKTNSDWLMNEVYDGYDIKRLICIIYPGISIKQHINV